MLCSLPTHALVSCHVVISVSTKTVDPSSIFLCQLIPIVESGVQISACRSATQAM